MSWIAQLYETYEQCAGKEGEGITPLLPIAHTIVSAHVEVVLNGKGQFLRARILEKSACKTIIPCTEASAGRTGKSPVNHPLCDSLQFVAGDFVPFGGTVTVGYQKNPHEPHEKYCRDLSAWFEEYKEHPMLSAIWHYVQKKTLVADLVRSRILPLDEAGKFTKTASRAEKETWTIWKSLTANSTPEDAVIRWRVEIAGENNANPWEDQALIQAWITHYQKNSERIGFCHATGKNVRLAGIQPAKLRHGKDQAKLISSNDNTGYTFRGRFENADQACTLGFEVTQKAHNALRWLLSGKRCFRNGEQAIIAWEISGKDIPSPCQSSDEFFDEDELSSGIVETQDAGLYFALSLKKKIAGYAANLQTHAKIMVMVLDAATPGRMSIVYYRELAGSEFLERLESWHYQFFWEQHFSKERHFVGAPAPYDIALTAYGESIIRQDKKRKLLKATVERLLPCIIDGQAFPEDIWRSIFNRVTHPEKMEFWEWRKLLGIACAIFRGINSSEDYKMSLETERTTRDYLYGRLLAVADFLEHRALYVAKEKRDTNAAKLLPRFADHPYSTWLQIEKALNPYKSRLCAKRPAELRDLKRLQQEIMDAFAIDDFCNDGKLSGEFLLAYHCQNKALWDALTKKEPEAIVEGEAEE